MTPTQELILSRVITDAGLTQEQADEICLILSDESRRTQEAFYYRCLGFTHAEIGELMGCSRQNIGALLAGEKKVKNYFKEVASC